MSRGLLTSRSPWKKTLWKVQSETLRYSSHCFKKKKILIITEEGGQLLKMSAGRPAFCSNGEALKSEIRRYYVSRLTKHLIQRPNRWVLTLARKVPGPRNVNSRNNFSKEFSIISVILLWIVSDIKSKKIYC